MKSTGEAAERRAAAFLERHGLTLLETNYRCRFGEIDLIMRHGAETVFVEVRMRRHNSFGGAAASITPQKQQRLRATALHYFATHGERPCRFDVVLVNALEGGTLEWIRNAIES